jgi:hypothetical protein
MPTPSEITWAQIAHVNHDKAWHVLRRLSREGLLVPLARALRCVPANQLESIFASYAYPHELGDVEAPAPRRLVETVREFTEAALRGEFYEDFLVNSHNCTEKSGKTEIFAAQLDLLFDRCVEEAPTGDPAEVCKAYDLLLDLLREIDKFEKEIVFFADEGGAWQFGVHWQRVLRGYIRCLAKTVSAEGVERQDRVTGGSKARPEPRSLVWSHHSPPPGSSA